MVEFAISGISRIAPFEWNGVKVYGATPFGGQFGLADWSTVQQLEKPDVWCLNWDLWASGNTIPKTGVKYVAYVPIDHDPLPPVWLPSLKGAYEIIPYCAFGERVIKEGLGMTYPIVDPIPHGVDTGTFRPMEVSKTEAFGRETPQDAFTVGIFKNNQGTRAKYEVQLQGWKLFLEQTGNKNARLYIHANRTGSTAFDLEQLVQLLGITGSVYIIAPSLYRFGLTDEGLAEMYNACDVILNAVAGEGWGLPITEAFACGKPVIATACTSMSELLSGEEGEIKIDGSRWDHGQCLPTERGWLVPTSGEEWTLGKVSTRRVFRSEDVAAALLAAYENPQQRVEKGKAARVWVEQFNWRKVGEQWISYFDGLEERLAPKKYSWKSIKPKPVRFNKTACAVFSFNRPTYLIQALDALAKNTQVNECDWYLFQDGWQNNPKRPYASEAEEQTNEKLVAQCVQVMEGVPLRHKTVITREENVCIGKQVFEAWDDLFAKYDNVLFFDDDHVVSPDYIDLLMRIHEQYPDAIVGAQATEPQNIPARAGLEHVGITVDQAGDQRPGRWRWLAYLMPRSVYEATKEGMDEYFAFIGDDYRDLPHNAVRIKWGVQVTGWDGVMDAICNKLGIRRIATVVPRGRYIGESGLFGSPGFYRSMGFGQNLRYEFKEDQVTEFKEWS